MKRFSVVLSALFFAIALPHSISLAQTTNLEIPSIELWEETANPFGNMSMGHPTKTVITWHKDSRGKGYEGNVLYFMNSSGELTMFLKSWNFVHYGSRPYGFDWRESRTALLLENGEWFIGDEGEMVSIMWEFNDQDEVIAVTYSFTDINSSISRTIKFE